MFDYIKKDINRYVVPNKKHNITVVQFLKVMNEEPGLKAILVYRFGRWILMNSRKINVLIFLKPVYRLLATIIKKFYGIDVSVLADIGAGFFIGHFFGICIGEVIIGSNCSVHQHVKINCPHDNKPNANNQNTVIGSNVWIGAHSIVNGGVDIADGATISAGSRVAHDILTPSLVMGEKGRIIQRHYDNSSIL